MTDPDGITGPDEMLDYSTVPDVQGFDILGPVAGVTISPEGAEETEYLLVVLIATCSTDEGQASMRTRFIVRLDLASGLATSLAAAVEYAGAIEHHNVTLGTQLLDPDAALDRLRQEKPDADQR